MFDYYSYNYNTYSTIQDILSEFAGSYQLRKMKPEGSKEKNQKTKLIAIQQAEYSYLLLESITFQRAI